MSVKVQMVTEKRVKSAALFGWVVPVGSIADHVVGLHGVLDGHQGGKRPKVGPGLAFDMGIQN